MVYWPPIDRDDLQQAANRDGFDAVLPQLVRRLIAETAIGLTELDMPGESGVAIGGFDGVVTAEQASIEVPAGTSVWELSVSKGSGTKASADYSKRIQGPDGRSPENVTYVQLILAPWTRASAWAKERNLEGHWREVRALNLDAVRGWLDRAPATAVWLAGRLGKEVPGTRSLEDWFGSTWLASTRIPLGSDIVLAGRDREADQLRFHLETGKSTVTVTGDMSADEFLAFVAASIERVDEPQRQSLKSRLLFVNEPTALSTLMVMPEPLVIVVPDARLAANSPVRGPHQVVIFAPLGSEAEVNVGRADSQKIAEQLVFAGESHENAGPLGALARRSMSALRRALAIQPATLRPSWADSPDVTKRRLLLIGEWDAGDPDDRALIERCTGRAWVDVQDALLHLTGPNETPMFGRLDELWYLVSPSDAWLLVWPHFSQEDISELCSAAIAVLTEPDPLHGLSAAQSLIAQMDGVRRRYSHALRRGIARSLALLGATASSHPLAIMNSGSDHVRRTIRQILKLANADPTYALWDGLRPWLGELAEGAPDEFIAAMQHGLRGAEPLHARMFTDGEKGGSVFEISAGHSEFLWALETVAWSSEHFDEAVDILASLAVIDPGGKYINRPSSSLAAIFSCWYPATSASSDQRERVLRRLLRDLPNVTRALLVDLIPDGSSIQVGHHAPQFRDWKQEVVLTRADVEQSVRFVAQLLLGSLDDEPSEYLPIIAKIDLLHREERRVFCEQLVHLGESLTAEDDRAALSGALRAIIYRHREYSDTGWALQDEDLVVIEAAEAALAPRHVLHRHSWLFADAWIEIGDISRRDDFEAYEGRVQELRAQAASDVLTERGLKGIEELACGTKWPNLVGFALFDLMNNNDSAEKSLDKELLIWLDRDVHLSAVAFSYFSRLIADSNTEVVDALVDAAGEARAKAAVLRAMSDYPSAWARLGALDKEVAKEYWKSFQIYGLGDFAPVLEAAEGLMGAGRYSATLIVLSLYTKKIDTDEGAECAARAAEKLFTSDSSDPELRELSQHAIQNMVDLMHRHRGALGMQRLVNIEWQLFPGLGFEPNAPTLYEALASDPNFFAELVELSYPWGRFDADAEEPVSTDERQGVEPPPKDDPSGSVNDSNKPHVLAANRAREILRSWNRVPGTQPNGEIDARQLEAWVHAARESSSAREMGAVGDSEIGAILAKAPKDDDGTYPPCAVRELLERLQSDGVESGLKTGIYNRRGVATRGLMDGGVQELKLASFFREQALAAGEWLRTRKLLRGLADDYERDARHVEGEAEQFRRGLGR